MPTPDTYHRKITSILDVLDELEWETRHYLQNPQAPVHGVPGEPPPAVPRAPVQTGVELRFDMGREALERHFEPPIIIWTLGNTNLAKKVERRIPNPRIPGAAPRLERQQPKSFKTAAELITAYVYGAPDPKESNPRRKSVRGTERLKVALLYAIHAHWHGVVAIEGPGWQEVPGASVQGYAYVIPFRVDLALLRPEQGLAVVREVEASHEIETPPISV
jgi:hypothetical protein